ncbi:hypothetical protein RHMOL_Rhmol04G0156800 [Rhododendron molle]|nr:hypothetical protein RHMOL_Rhmol04G0156800 [Rhododendron molle]
MRRHDSFCLCGRCSVGSKKVQGAPEEMEDDVIVVGFDDRGGFSYAAIFYGHAGFFFRRVSQISYVLFHKQVIFDPYKDRRQNVSEIAFYTGPIRAMSYVEPYLPDRVLRQFGLLQRIPADPIAPLRASRGQHTYDVVYEWTEGFCSSPDYHLVPEDKRERTPPGIPWVCTEDYLPWLMVFSHPRVGRGMAPIGGRVRQGREEQYEE